MNKTMLSLAAVAALGAGSSAMAVGDYTVSIPLQEVLIYAGAHGAATNTHLVADLAAMVSTPGNEVTITGIGWDLELTTFGASWGNEAVIAFNNSAGVAGVFLTPSSTSGPVAGEILSSDGMIKLADVGIPDIVLSDGILDLEFFDTFNDNFPNPDAVMSGLIHVQFNKVPAPGALALIGLAGLTGVSRRRRA